MLDSSFSRELNPLCALGFGQSPRMHFGCSLKSWTVLNTLKNDARGNGVSSRVVVGESGECSPKEADASVRYWPRWWTGQMPLGPSPDPGAASLTSVIGNPARRRTWCQESIWSIWRTRKP